MNSHAMLRLSQSLLLGLAIHALAVPSPAWAADVDQDGLDDSIEDALLARYRPYFLFSKGEKNWPLPATTYVYNTEVKTAADSKASTVIALGQIRQDPLSILRASRLGANFCSYWNGRSFCTSDLTSNARPTNYALNALSDPSGGFKGASPVDGFPSEAVRRIGNVGLYGHVVPIRLSTVAIPCGMRWNKVERPAEAQIYYKVEYWQFFGFNDANQPAGIANHEGDWTTVQLLVRPASISQTPCANGQGICAVPLSERAAAVMHFSHGQEFRFILRKSPPDRSWTQYGEQFGEFHGPNYGKDVSINSEGPACSEAVLNAQNNVLRMIRDSESGRWTHPAVYLERGAHEFWPTPNWTYWRSVGGIRYDAPLHWGEGLRFLTATPPNLGEVEAPRNSDPNTLLVLRYNGRWGADNSWNSPPYGPPLHAQWTWPASSSIGWQLPDNLDY